MKNYSARIFAILLLSALAHLLTFSTLAADNIRVLLIVGGHGFEAKPFQQLFQEMPGIHCETVSHTNAQRQAHDLFKPAAAATYDVIVCYDMWQKISEETKSDLKNLLKQGKGLVVLHHALANYQDWPEFARIAGGQYVLPKKGQKPGPKDSTYKHDVIFKVHIEDPSHPITQGLSDFEIHDETYGNLTVNADAHPLLSTDEPTSNKLIGWCKQYESSRVAAIQLGHDHLAYENPHFRQLLRQAIGWVAKAR